MSLVSFSWTGRWHHIFGSSESGTYLRDCRLFLNLGPRDHQSFKMSVEWKQRLKQGLNLHLVTGGEGNDIGFNLCLPLVGWFSVRCSFLPYKWSLRVFGYADRETGVTIDSSRVSVDLGYSWTSYRNKGFSKNFWFSRVPDWLFGKSTLDRRPVEARKLSIPMPERVYQGVFTKERWVRSRKRFKWLIPDKESTFIDIDLGSDPIPVPGKGSTSYNCGEDAIFGTGHSGESYAEAVGHVVKRVLTTRDRYGSGMDWKPRKEWRKIDHAV